MTMTVARDDPLADMGSSPIVFMSLMIAKLTRALLATRRARQHFVDAL